MQRQLLHGDSSGHHEAEQPLRLQGQKREQQLRRVLPDLDSLQHHPLILDNRRSIMRLVNLNWF